MEKIAQVDIGVKFGSPFGQEKGLGDLATIFLSNALIVAGIILLFLLVLGGIGVIVGAGKGNPERAEKGKKAVTAALVGFIVVFVAYWIVQLIGIITGVSLLGT